jgi:hypothetical protein
MLSGLFAHGGMAAPGLLWTCRTEKAKDTTLGYTTASCSWVFVGLPSGRPNTNLSLFPPCHIWRRSTGMCRHSNFCWAHGREPWGQGYKKTGGECGKVAVNSLELLSLTEGFLGIASVCLALAVWRFCNKSLGRLCHARHASAWGFSHRVPCCRACLRMGEWLPQNCCGLAGRKKLRTPPWDIPLLRAVGFL